MWIAAILTAFDFAMKIKVDRLIAMNRCQRRHLLHLCITNSFRMASSSIATIAP